MKKVLFVCLGNICRSPAAEGVFRQLIEKEGLLNEFQVDSCGTSGLHAGEMADKRMREAAIKRGFKLNSISRGLEDKDLIEFDIILAMDDSNFNNILKSPSAEEFSYKVKKMCDFVHELPFTEVPDPYYGGEQGFETVLDILEEGSKNLLIELNKWGVRLWK